MIKNILLSILLVFSIVSPVYALNLECSLNPTYYKDSAPILVYGNSSFDGVSFQILCSNILENEKILSLRIINASPIEFYNSLPINKTISILAMKNKIMWTSEIISVKSFNETYMNFSISIIGVKEQNWTIVQADALKTIYIKNTEENQAISIGAKIFPSHPILGVLIPIGFIILLILVIWYSDFGDRISRWKRNRQLKKLVRTKEEQRWRQMR